MKSTFEQILVPTDFGDAAEHALEVGIAIAEKFGAGLTLMHSYGIPISYSYDGGILWPIDELRGAAEAEMAKALTQAAKTFPSIRSQLTGGDPSIDILDSVKAVDADLVVMGTHGRRGVARLLLGSVAEKTVRLACVPVLVVPARAR